MLNAHGCVVDVASSSEAALVDDRLGETRLEGAAINGRLAEGRPAQARAKKTPQNARRTESMFLASSISKSPLTPLLFGTTGRPTLLTTARESGR